MKYFGLNDPITRVFTDRVSATQTDVVLYINNIPAGFNRMSHDESTQFIKNVLATQLEVADIEDGILTWHSDYAKTHVISEDGELVPVTELSRRED